MDLLTTTAASVGAGAAVSEARDRVRRWQWRKKLSRSLQDDLGWTRAQASSVAAGEIDPPDKPPAKWRRDFLLRNPVPGGLAPMELEALLAQPEPTIEVAIEEWTAAKGLNRGPHIERFVEHAIHDQLDRDKIVLLRGPSLAGKSHLIGRVAEHLEPPLPIRVPMAGGSAWVSEDLKEPSLVIVDAADASFCSLDPLAMKRFLAKGHRVIAVVDDAFDLDGSWEAWCRVIHVAPLKVDEGLTPAGRHTIEDDYRALDCSSGFGAAIAGASEVIERYRRSASEPWKAILAALLLLSQLERTMDREGIRSCTRYFRAGVKGPVPKAQFNKIIDRLAKPLPSGRSFLTLEDPDGVEFGPGVEEAISAGVTIQTPSDEIWAWLASEGHATTDVAGLALASGAVNVSISMSVEAMRNAGDSEAAMLVAAFSIPKNPQVALEACDLLDEVDYPQVHLLRFKAHSAVRATDSAVGALRAGVEAGDPLCSYELGRSLESKDQLAAARAYRAALEGGFVPAALPLAALSSNEPREAVQILEEATELGFGPGAVALAIHHLHHGDAAASVNALEDAIRITVTEEELISYGRELADDGLDSETAAGVASRLSEAHRDGAVWPLLILAERSAQLGESSRATELYAQLAGRGSFVAAGRATLLAVDFADANRVEQELSALLQDHPIGETVHQLAMIQSRRGDRDKAIELWTAAVALGSERSRTNLEIENDLGPRSISDQKFVAALQHSRALVHRSYLGIAKLRCAVLRELRPTCSVDVDRVIYAALKDEVSRPKPEVWWIQELAGFLLRHGGREGLRAVVEALESAISQSPPKVVLAIVESLTDAVEVAHDQRIDSIPVVERLLRSNYWESVLQLVSWIDGDGTNDLDLDAATAKMEALRNLKRLPEAIKCADALLIRYDLHDSAPSDRASAVVLGNCIRVLRKAEDANLPELLALQERALRWFRNNGAPVDTLRGLSNRAELFKLQGDNESAVECLEEAVALTGQVTTANDLLFAADVVTQLQREMIRWGADFDEVRSDLYQRTADLLKRAKSAGASGVQGMNAFFNATIAKEGGSVISVAAPEYGLIDSETQS